MDNDVNINVWCYNMYDINRLFKYIYMVKKNGPA